MDWKKGLTALGGVLFAVAAAIVHLKAGPAWLQTSSLIAMTALGFLGFGVTKPLFASQPQPAPVVELKSVGKDQP